MNQIQDLTPINLQTEKAKFFADHKYNPQFTYATEILSEFLTQYGQPTETLTELAKNILDRTYYGRNQADLIALEGARCNQAEVEKTTRSFLKLHGLADRFGLVFSQSYMSRASATAEAIRFRLPIVYRKEGLLGSLYHEVGTHAIRRVNYEQQPWFKKKQKFGFSPYLETEEGLAVLHSLLPKSFCFAHVVARKYIAAGWAQTMSFAQLWHKLSRYIQDPDKLWSETVRQKRGLEDTAHPGGFTKDILYFSGLIKVYQWLKTNQFDPTKLYIGKIALKDVEQALALNPEFEPLLPVFFRSQPSKYATKVSEIGKINSLD